MKIEYICQFSASVFAFMRYMYMKRAYVHVGMSFMKCIHG